MESSLSIVDGDWCLSQFRNFFYDIQQHTLATRGRLIHKTGSLEEFAKSYEYFGLHFIDKQWIFREWAPSASKIYLIGTFSNWEVKEEFSLHRLDEGNWEIRLPEGFLKHKDLYRLHVVWHGGSGDRIPSHANSVVQDPETKIFSARVWHPDQAYQWKVPNFKKENDTLLIYETHVGMAQEEEGIGTYSEFREKILPRIIDAGYTAIQIMGIQEHPYYASFGYQVSSFFAPSGRFGTPDDLKELVDAAHEGGLTVLLDIVHSHAVRNEVEGLSRFDGSLYQYFYDHDKGAHPVWDSRLFDYGKNEVLRFLLSNLQYWIKEFKFDGFRFDGVTSMIYRDHGLEDSFWSYEAYFNNRVERDALSYICMANDLVHSLGDYITIAEDVSGLPGLASPREIGGFGFDYRLAMGIPDFWEKTIKKKADEDWHVEEIFGELSNRRYDEKTISYVECHDQSMVGDHPIFFQLAGEEMYNAMRIDQQNDKVTRSTALHRMIRLVTLATAGHGYLNFMGNEFGHPEWIDFPREGNNWSYYHARRKWSLRDNKDLQFYRLAEFDKALIWMVKQNNIFSSGPAEMVHSHFQNQVIGFYRAGLLFFFNFNPFQSFSDYSINVWGGEYKIVLDSDHWTFGGQNRVAEDQRFHSYTEIDGSERINIYLPTRTALVLQAV